MKKYLFFIGCLAFIALVATSTKLLPVSAAGGGSFTYSLSASPTSLTADNSSTTTLTARWYDSNTGIGIADGPVLFSVSGSGNSLSSSSATTGADGYASVTLRSSVAETKTITLTHPPSIGSVTANVAFTAPVATPPPSAPPAATPPPATSRSSSLTPATNTAVTPVAAPSPAAPKPEEVMFNGEAIADAKTKPSFTSDKPIVVSGKTTPGATVTLYIFSTPKKYSVVADTAGNWTYTIKNLPAGSHHVEAQITDQTSKLTSPRSTVGSFTVTAAAKTTQATQSTQKPSLGLLWMSLGFLLVIALAGIVLFIRHKKAHPVNSL